MRGKRHAKMKAKKLLQQYGFNVENIDVKKNNLSIDVEAVADSLRINVIRHAFSDEVSGVFFRKNVQLYLGVNEHHHDHRQRFTIAHEIGHYVLHSSEILHYDKTDLERVYFRTDNISDLNEIEANHFAAELLMPEDLIYKCINYGIRSIKELADKLNVSEDAMRYRLTNLGLL
jgi:Zn-dependent peptidase ImmA (M78 family)